jgi:O-acetyl-ADP-ribose deacetylase (regulator of RNase III)
LSRYGRRTRALAETESIESIAIPRIGVGYGGLSWKKVRPIIERVFGDWSSTLIVYEQYAPRGSGETAAPGAAADRPRD